jgi:hypothetical protein
VTDPVALPETCDAPAGTRAFLVFQIADHWGNRLTPRPSPRADVLAAALWIPWLSSAHSRGGVAAGMSCRYADLLATELALALVGQPRDADEISLLQQRGGALRAELLDEPAYRQVLLTPAHDANLAALTLSHRLVEIVLLGGSRSVSLPGLVRHDAATALEVRPAGPRAYRLRPWPLVGRRLDVHADLPGAEAGAARRVWTLLPTGAEVD